MNKQIINTVERLQEIARTLPAHSDDRVFLERLSRKFQRSCGSDFQTQVSRQVAALVRTVNDKERLTDELDTVISCSLMSFYEGELS